MGSYGMSMRAALLCAMALSATALPTATKIPTVKLNDGSQMPIVGLGTWQYNDTLAGAAVKAALSVGYTHIDTANDYGNQKGIGAAIKGVSRSSLFITSKVPGCGVQGIGATPAKCASDTTKAFQDNLDQLGVKQVDLMLIHFPPPTGCNVLTCKSMQSQWATFETAHTQGKAKTIGVSNFCQSCFECLLKTAKVVPAVNQVQFHVGMGADPVGLHSYCKSKGVQVQAYSPLADGKDSLIHNALTTKLGGAHNKSSVQAALKWIVSNNVPLVTKSSNPAHLAQDLDLFDWDFTSSEMDQLNKATSPSGKSSFMCTK